MKNKINTIYKEVSEELSKIKAEIKKELSK